MSTFTTNSVLSKDGTSISYRQTGNGPGLILVPGGMMTSQNFTQLAGLLAGQFTVYIPDRRGRALSGPPGHHYELARECEDLAAIARKTSTHRVFGLSSGAIVTLMSALMFPAIHRIALYEPPLPFSDTRPDAWVARYEKELAAGNLAGAMTSVLKGTGDSWSMALLPRFILAPLLKLGIRAEGRKIKQGGTAMKDLVHTMHYDAQLVEEMRSKLALLRDLKADVLLMSGSRSKIFLQRAAEKLHRLLPGSRFMRLQGVGHIAASNDQAPARVAEVLKKFFAVN